MISERESRQVGNRSFQRLRHRPDPAHRVRGRQHSNFEKMLVPSTERIGGCRRFLVCAKAETTTETSKTSTSISPRRCTVASG